MLKKNSLALNMNYTYIFNEYIQQVFSEYNEYNIIIVHNTDT